MLSRARIFIGVVSIFTQRQAVEKRLTLDLTIRYGSSRVDNPQSQGRQRVEHDKSCDFRNEMDFGPFSLCSPIGTGGFADVGRCVRNFGTDI